MYRAGAREGQPIDFLLTPHRDKAAAAAFLHKAIRAHGLPEKITIDQSGSNTAAIHRYTRTHKTSMVSRHSQYVNNLVEQDHRAVKRMVRPMLGFKAFWRARGTIAGSEGMYAIRKGRLTIRETPPTPTEQCYACVA